MFDVIGLALAVLKFVNWLMDTIGREKLKRDGRDEEIARTTAAILAKTEYAKDVRAKIAAMDDQAVDAALRDLEPK
jgi:hypothetical protein